MGKEVSFYLSILLILAGVFVLSFIGFRFTGFVTFDQQTQTDFNMTNSVWENVTYQDNALVLDENQTTGGYTSGFIGDGNETQWNSLIPTGSENLSFEVRACDSIGNCTATFESLNLSNLNLTGNYLQYKVFFDSTSNSTTLNSVSVDYTLLSEDTGITLSVTNPSGAVETQNGISLDFNATNAENCWYSVDGGVTNATAENCTSTTFDVDSDGDYTIILYANNSGGEFEQASSSFTVDTQPEETTEEEKPVEEPVEEEVTETTEPSDFTNELTLSLVNEVVVNPNRTTEAVLSVENTGDTNLFFCELVPSGNYAEWISAPNVSETFTVNDTKEFKFEVTAPGEIAEGGYSLGIMVSCSTYSKLLQFNTEVVEEKIGFELVDVRRTADDEVRVDYLLEELTGSEQDVEISFQLVDQDDEIISETSENQSLNANESDEFRVEILVNESAIPVNVNETTNETTDSEFTLRVGLNSQIYSSTIQEPILLGAPLSGFAVFTGDFFETRNLVTLGLIILGLAGAFLAVRVYRRRFNRPKEQ